MPNAIPMQTKLFDGCTIVRGNKIRIVHFIATKFGLKGAWDAGDGGRSKIQLRKAETKNIRSPTALAAFKTLFY